MTCAWGSRSGKPEAADSHGTVGFDGIDGLPVQAQEGGEKAVTGIPVGGCEGVVGVHQKESGIQVSLDGITAREEEHTGAQGLFVILTVGMVELAGAVLLGVHLMQLGACVLLELLIEQSQEGLGSAVGDGLAEAFLFVEGPLLLRVVSLALAASPRNCICSTNTSSPRASMRAAST